jgi:glycosyltransferase involved in cell wall biosynthesis
MGLVVGVNGCRNRSGGAVSHLIGILRDSDPIACGIKQVHVWSYQKLLDAIPDHHWLVKHSAPQLEKSLPHQLWWEYHHLPREARRTGCDVLLNTDAGSLCYFRPSVVMSRDMLSYEPGEIDRYRMSKARLRLIALRFVQNRSLRHADGVIFLTNHAAKVIQRATGKLNHVSIIPHGVGAAFKQETSGGAWQATPDKLIRCLYVSNAAMYKHQWVVVKAIGELRKRGRNVSLTLAGGGSGAAQRLLDEEIARTDPRRTFVECVGSVQHDQVPQYLAKADIFIFASSCENMPNTLVEAMASGLPIACSDRGPMPEILQDGGVYFTPESADSISKAIEQIIADPQMRISIARRAKVLSERYSWTRCGSETWSFLQSVVPSREKKMLEFRNEMSTSQIEA